MDKKIIDEKEVYTKLIANLAGDKKDDIVNFVKKHKMVDTQTMSDYLGWGKQIGFRRYRNFLRTVGGIYTTVINKKEYYVYNENFTTIQRTIR